MSATDTNDDGFVSNGFRGGVLTRKEEERIECLKRRLKFLEKLIERSIDAGAKNKRLDYNRHEASSLRWAIEAITGKPVS